MAALIEANCTVNKRGKGEGRMSDYLILRYYRPGRLTFLALLHSVANPMKLFIFTSNFPSCALVM